jgi:hypothetical protein
MPSSAQDQEFASQMESHVTVSKNALDEATEWIGKNLNPDDVFSDKALANWAESNGYIKE